MGTSWVRRLTGTHPRLVDGTLAVAFTLLNVVWGLNDQTSAARPFDTVSVLLTAAANLPLVLRRSHPFAVLVACCSATLVYHSLGYSPDQNVLGVLVALYSVAAHLPPRGCATGTLLTVAAWAYASGAQDPAAPWWAALARAVVVCGFVVAFGLVARRLGRQNRRLVELTERLRQERDTSARLAVTQERVRIARELHDVVAHHLSVVSVQAETGRYVLASDPEIAGRALATIADTSREALAEMQRLLSVLRIGVDDEQSASHDQAHGLESLEVLLEKVRGAGVVVDVTVTGSPRPLPSGLESCIYRIVQESLTNIVKHAAPTRARIDLTYGTGTITVKIVDDGPAESRTPRTGSETRDTAGYGLVGMTERVALYRGTIFAGPGRGGGFEVNARIPLPPGDPRPAGEDG